MKRFFNSILFYGLCIFPFCAHADSIVCEGNYCYKIPRSEDIIGNCSEKDLDKQCPPEGRKKHPYATETLCVSVKEKQSSPIATPSCAATECKNGYLLWLYDGNPMGVCHSIDYAESQCYKYCSNCPDGQECRPLLKPTPRTNKTDGAYDNCSCQPKIKQEEVHTSIPQVKQEIKQDSVQQPKQQFVADSVSNTTPQVVLDSVPQTKIEVRTDTVPQTKQEEQDSVQRLQQIVRDSLSQIKTQVVFDSVQRAEPPVIKYSLVSQTSPNQNAANTEKPKEGKPNNDDADKVKSDTEESNKGGDKKEGADTEEPKSADTKKEESDQEKTKNDKPNNDDPKENESSQGNTNKAEPKKEVTDTENPKTDENKKEESDQEKPKEDEPNNDDPKENESSQGNTNKDEPKKEVTDTENPNTDENKKEESDQEKPKDDKPNNDDPDGNESGQGNTNKDEPKKEVTDTEEPKTGDDKKDGNDAEKKDNEETKKDAETDKDESKKDNQQGQQQDCVFRFTAKITCKNGVSETMISELPLPKSLVGQNCPEDKKHDFDTWIKKQTDAVKQKVAELCPKEHNRIYTVTPNITEIIPKVSYDDYVKATATVQNFFESADEKASGWKEADGKVNAKRVASDVTAGVVLGTVGGVVSGVVIKKKQIEKGFDVLHCDVGGQKKADWGDTFTIGLEK